MGGRGSGGGRSSGGGSASKTQNKTIKKKKELTPEEIKQQKAEELKQKRLEALAKARAKRAENLKNGVKPKPKKPKQKKNLYLGFENVGIGDKYKLRDGSKLEIVDMGFDDAYGDNYYVAYKLNGHRNELSKSDFNSMGFRT